MENFMKDAKTIISLLQSTGYMEAVRQASDVLKRKEQAMRVAMNEIDNEFKEDVEATVENKEFVKTILG